MGWKKVERERQLGEEGRKPQTIGTGERPLWAMGGVAQGRGLTEVGTWTMRFYLEGKKHVGKEDGVP